MRNVFRLLALVVVMMTVTTVFAHHSFGATYDTSKHYTYNSWGKFKYHTIPYNLPDCTHWH